MKKKYENLVNILDQIRLESPVKFKKYRPENSDFEKINQARARCLIHLYLKVNYGLLDFSIRESYITDKGQDGGIDAYYIDKKNKKIILIQSKFRTTHNGFENKEIALEELLKMDISRVTEGEKEDENGNKYNGKILQLQRQIREIDDIGRYDYVVVILANIKSKSETNLKKLSGGYKTVIYSFEKVYEELVFPVVSGTFYKEEELQISLNLAGKSSGAKVTYNIKTESGNCDITVLFVPVSEIAKTLYEYKNSILKYNPRSYLELAGNNVNRSIYDSITTRDTNEFALFNNGITILSDETDINEKVGKKDLAQLIITNPQIINGGQTSFTLSRIHKKILNGELPETVFDGKEVLLRIVTLDSDNATPNKLDFIESISKSTNNQSQIKAADRRANDKVQIELQRQIYNDYGLYYERKKGEFADGIKDQYIERTDLINRVDFIKMALASNFPNNTLNPKNVSETKLFSEKIFENIVGNGDRYHEYMFAYLSFVALKKIKAEQSTDKKDIYGESKYGKALRYGEVAVAMIAKYKYYHQNIDLDCIETSIKDLLLVWNKFEINSFNRKTNSKYFNVETNENNPYAYYKGDTVNKDLLDFFKNE
jgi:hypothetical protein